MSVNNAESATMNYSGTFLVKYKHFGLVFKGGQSKK